jgi:hypothetical protein
MPPAWPACCTPHVGLLDLCGFEMGGFYTDTRLFLADTGRILHDLLRERRFTPFYFCA